MSTDQIQADKRPKLLTVWEVCGVFNKDRRAVEKMGIPRVVLGPGDYRYNLADVEAFIAERTER